MLALDADHVSALAGGTVEADVIGVHPVEFSHLLSLLLYSLDTSPFESECETLW